MALSLAEEFLLLALDDEKGSFATWTDYGVAGAILVDLLDRSRLHIEDRKVVPLASGGTDDEVLDRALSVVSGSAKPRPVMHWAAALASQCEARPALIARLVSAGLLREEQHRFLRVFPYSRYPSADTGPEAEIVARLRAVLLDGASPDARSAALISLLKSCYLLGAIATGAEQKAAKRRIHELSQADAGGPAVGSALAEVEAAVAAAVAAVIITTT